MSQSIPLNQISLQHFDEETARADVYGLLAALYYAPPSEELLAQIQESPTEPTSDAAFLPLSWGDFQECARSLSLSEVQDEFDALFGGIGRPEVLLFASHYLTGFLNEKPLVELRNDLNRLGLERDPALPETEDHLSYLCEVMRYLIAGDDVEVANLTEQRAFFTTHLLPWVKEMCDTLANHPRAHFYAQLAHFTRAFIDVESQAFDMMN